MSDVLKDFLFFPSTKYMNVSSMGGMPQMYRLLNFTAAPQDQFQLNIKYTCFFFLPRAHGSVLTTAVSRICAFPSLPQPCLIFFHVIYINLCICTWDSGTMAVWSKLIPNPVGKVNLISFVALFVLSSRSVPFKSTESRESNSSWF